MRRFSNEEVQRRDSEMAAHSFHLQQQQSEVKTKDAVISKQQNDIDILQEEIEVS